jgi:hypothetical protein
MIKYNWEKVKRIGDYEPTKILQYFCFKEGIWVSNYLPKDYSKKIYSAATEPYPTGSSYMLNIRPVLMNKENYFIDDIWDYIKLASMRSLFEYKMQNVITLPVVIAKVARVDLINPLIQIDNGNIHFKHEQRKQRSS